MCLTIPKCARTLLWPGHLRWELSSKTSQCRLPIGAVHGDLPQQRIAEASEAQEEEEAFSAEESQVAEV